MERLTSKGKSCLLSVLRTPKDGSFERFFGIDKDLKTGSRPLSEDPIIKKYKPRNLFQRFVKMNAYIEIRALLLSSRGISEVEYKNREKR